MNDRSSKTVKGKRVVIVMLVFLCAALMAYGAGGPEPEGPCAPIPSPGEDEEMLEFGVRVVYPKVYNGIPLQVNLIPLKPKKEWDYPKEPNGTEKPVYWLFNLDIYGGAPDEVPEKRQQVGKDGFRPEITVYISYKSKTEDLDLNIYYFIPGRNGAEGQWVSHEEAIRLGRRIDMIVTPLKPDDKTRTHSFTIRMWPIDDRAMCSDG
jgi:hypothetical protein